MAAKWTPQHHRDITLARLDGLSSAEPWHNSVNITTCLTQLNAPVSSISVWHSPGLDRPSFAVACQQTYAPCKVGDSFGPSWSTHWFKVTVTVPDTWADEGGAGGVTTGIAGEPLLLVWDSGSEAMVWSAEGEPLQGITDGRNEHVLCARVEPGAVFTVLVEMACNGVGGVGDGILPPPDDRRYTLKAVHVSVPSTPARQLLADLAAVGDVARSAPRDSALAARALYVANQMCNLFRREDPSTWEAARKVAQEVLASGPAPALHTVTAVGHCHIDTAWLWPFEETRRKVARSWVSQLVLMDRHPQYKFAASSAQQYAWLQEDYPGLFTRLQAAAAAGRFLPVGGSWVEMDTNLPCGESLVRQLLYGQRYFESAFGQRHDTFWLPDTFGYCAQLPQLLVGAGMASFLTQKLSWNNINVFPHNTFWWEALDGSRVLTHFPPSNTYVSQVSVGDLVASVGSNKDADRCPVSLLLFGNGDGGGGPTEAHCQALTRLSGPTGQGLDGLVRVAPGSPSDFFATAHAASRDLLTWRGELYLEFHRGTYTTHAANKAGNRRCEGLLRDTEAAAALAVAVGAPGYTYPRAELESIWQQVLLFQFHDVLPGSAIQAVYDHTSQVYPQLTAQLHNLRAAALSALLNALTQHAHAPHAPPPAAAAPESVAQEAREPPESPYSAAEPPRSAAESPHSAGSTSAGGSCGEWCVLGVQDIAGARMASVASSPPSPLAAPPAPGSRPHPTAPLPPPHPHPHAHPPQEAAAQLPADVLAPPPRNPFIDAHTAWVGTHPTAHHAYPAPQPTSGLNNNSQPDAAQCPAAGTARAAPNTAVTTTATAATTTTAIAVAAAVPRGVSRTAPEAGDGLWVFNSLSCYRHEVVEVPADAVPPGTHVAQTSVAGDAPGSALVAVYLPPFSLTPVFPSHPHQRHSSTTPLHTHLAPAAPAAPAAPVAHPAAGGGDGEGGHVAPWLNPGAALNPDACGVVTARQVKTANGDLVYELRNPYVRAVLDARGRLVSLYDRQACREGVPAGQLGNRMRLYDDQPLFWDAWDVEVYHLETGRDAGTPASVEVLEGGPLRAALRFTAPLTPTSTLTQTVTLTAVSPRLDFVNHVDWHEDRTCLKVEFPVGVRADVASYEVQYGAVTRPTHQNTSWDWARFEVCAHRWADLSEPDWGVALLNDCKYGHAAIGSVLTLTLLRAPKAPDATTDMGHHTFTYSLLPHSHGWQCGGVVTAGRCLNSPPVLVPAPPTSPRTALAHSHGQHPSSVQAVAPAMQDGVQAMQAGVQAGQPTAVADVAPCQTVGPHPTLVAAVSHFASLLRVVPCKPDGHTGMGDAPGNSPKDQGLGKPAEPLVLDTVKLAELVLSPGSAPLNPGAGPGAPVQLVLRLYEPHGCRGSAAVFVHPALRVLACVKCNLLEDPEGDVADVSYADVGCGGGEDVAVGLHVAQVHWDDGGVWARLGPVAYTPWQVISLLITLA